MKMGNSGEVVRKKRGGCDLQDRRARPGRSEAQHPPILASGHVQISHTHATIHHEELFAGWELVAMRLGGGGG